MKPSENIALIELGNTHQECLYSQLLILKKAGYRVHLVVSKKLFGLINYQSMWDHLYLHEVDGSGSILELFKISRYFKKNNVKKVVFNTAENAVVRNLLFLIPGIACRGILHDVSKLTSSRNQQFINRRIKKYFVLNDYLIDAIPPENRHKVTSFYPVFFPKTRVKKASPGINKSKSKSKNKKISIVIPGRLELKRRDYIGLIGAVEKAKLSKIQFVLLGNSGRADGQMIKTAILDKNLENQFVLFHEYLSEDDFQSQIEAADMVMPLVHPVNRDSSNYLVQNISGAFNFAFGYKKPMLMHEAFSQIDDFQAGCIFYNVENLALKLKSVEKNPKQIIKLKERLESYSKFAFDFQFKKYTENL